MKTLADEILGVLRPNAVTLRAIASALGADAASVRRAAQALNAADKAVLVRRKRVLHLASPVFAGFVCKNCYVEFERGPKSKRRCCSRFCCISWSWRRPGVREKRVASIKVERATPAAKARHERANKMRWSRAGEREKLADQNRREWADPGKKAQRAASIRASNGSAEFRKRASDYRKAYWQDPETRDRMIDAIRASETPARSAQRSASNRRRYSDLASREKYLEVSRKNIAKATAAITGKKQTREQVRKRTEKTKITRARNRAAANQGASA